MAVGAGARLGYVGVIGLCPEETLGTHKTSTSYIEFNSESMKKTIEALKLPAINMSRNYKRQIQTIETVEGSIEFDMDLASDFCINVIKQAMGGTVSSATIAADEMTHILSEGDMQSNKYSATSGTNTVAFSLQVRKGGVFEASKTGSGDVWDFNGCRVNNLSIKGEVGSPIIVTAELIGVSASISTDSLTASFSGKLPLDFSHVTIETGDSIGNITATEYYQSFEFSINNNLVPDSRNLGSRNIGVLPPTKRDTMLALTQRYDTTTSYDRYTSQTLTAFEITIAGQQTITAVAASTVYAMHIKLPRCIANPNMPVIDDPGLISQDVEYNCLQGNYASASYSCQMVVNNATKEYN